MLTDRISPGDVDEWIDEEHDGLLAADAGVEAGA